MDDHHAGGAAPRSFLIFVGPAAVIGHRLAAEIALATLEIGVVDEHHHDLAAQILALEVVPAALRRLHAVADEHQRRAVDRQPLVAVSRCADGDLLALGKRHGLAAQVEADLWRGREFRLQQRHGLGPLALAVDEVAARLQPRRSELLRQISDRLGLGSRRRGTALERVRSQGLDMLRQSLRTECCGRRGGSERNRGKRHRARCEQAKSVHVTLPKKAAR